MSTELRHRPITPLEAEAARDRIRTIALRAPLIAIETEEIGPVYLKLENLQQVGSFKIRGAASKLMSMDRSLLDQGVWTASAGNMAQGVAWCARLLRVPFTAVVPDTAPAAKTRPIERLGGQIKKVPRDDYFEIYTTRELVGQEGRFIHAFSDSEVMAGNATIALEILEDLPEVAAVYVPYGGGGLSCGIASIMRAQSKAHIIACEPDTANPVAASLSAGAPAEVESKATFIDGAGAPHVFPEMFELVQQLVTRAVSVTPEETASVLRLIAERAHVVAEGAGGLALAAALKDQPSGPVVCIVSGGNINPDSFAQILGGVTPTA